jgi:hypothetical protein
LDGAAGAKASAAIGAKVTAITVNAPKTDLKYGTGDMDRREDILKSDGSGLPKAGAFYLLCHYIVNPKHFQMR